MLGTLFSDLWFLILTFVIAWATGLLGGGAA